MTVEQIRRVHQARPFRPFTLKLADGSKVRVPHQESMWIHPSGRTIYVALTGDDFQIIDLLLVAAIEVSNGRRHPPRPPSDN